MRRCELILKKLQASIKDGGSIFSECCNKNEQQELDDSNTSKNMPTIIIMYYFCYPDWPCLLFRFNQFQIKIDTTEENKIDESSKQQ